MAGYEFILISFQFSIFKVHLHIVTFNVPWPADYGGVIDVYYRIVALAKTGVKIHLHCYTYGREEAKELEQWCSATSWNGVPT